MRLKITSFGESAEGIRLSGNPKSNEPAHCRIEFPGGDVEVVRAVDGDNADYWVHLRVNRPQDGSLVDGEDDLAKIIDARIDIRGEYAKAVEFKHPETYHIAMRVCRDGVYSLREALTARSAP